jgi:hypothetical protein
MDLRTADGGGGGGVKTPSRWVNNELIALAREVRTGCCCTPSGNAWPPSEEWARRLRALADEVDAARRGDGEDPPDSGETLGLEPRGGAL